ncbi:MAG: RNA polymerase sigma factor [Acidobacteria bacterium]|nr:MAG: RNA polymerase sigma factor [Acidobacteriota bacterium]REK06162.1 MAG: RNA polymerase sigma factor [Acidobacteriota bacterium]
MSLFPQTHDRRLQGRLLRGDTAAFDEFFATYHPALVRFALARLGGEMELAEEVAQVTLCQAVRKLHTWRGEASLLTWMFTICRRQMADELRRLGRRQEIPVSELDDEILAALESLSDPESDASRRARRHELAQRVRATLERLPSRQRQVLEGKYLRELSVREIAAALGVSEKAAESLLSRARASFREAFVLVERAAATAKAPRPMAEAETP